MITRFAPSPTGPLHLGHAYSALLAHDMARAENGTFLLRIEDIDRQRAKPEWEAQIIDDLTWLGITWDAAPLRQSDRLPAYRAALETLWRKHLIYPCTCNRRDILAAAAAPHEGEPSMGPDGVIYPGTCRAGFPTRDQLYENPPLPEGVTLRLSMEEAIERTMEDRITEKGPEAFAGFTETGHAPLGYVEFTATQMARDVGDIVLSRKDFLGSYHLSVVLDDADQGITHVIRGEDLYEATKIHVILQRLLGLPVPIYHHHRLIRDEAGSRLAKRDDARAIATYRAEGASPEDIRAMVGL
ncbi:tRNA glutamyl-Q(34) synthetase GluQRS [Gymnodinialimonas phycosphaerae]|uniref:tRNA glutamyl-Q(34) synthetase GluQRS n=1 Tax=Gymnodinialimonas phycosphaerae TaxID=2841589 RepID=UPI002150D54D|nr:tRNA glutamyl-Q(34) synthetase GluQRS [Gymnodinialimonas phycosphaerae]